ncbi:MAG: GspE/PulE family protein [Clostridiaceae bacterium]
MRNIEKKRLGDILLGTGKISYSQLEDTLLKQKSTGKRLGDIFIEDGILTNEDILDALHIQLKLPRADLSRMDIKEETVKLVPENLARRYNLIAVGFSENDENKLIIVMNDPFNFFATDDVKIATGYDTEIMLATKKEIKDSLDKYYSSQYVQMAADELKNSEQEEISKEDEASLEDIKNAPVVKLVDTIISNAVKAKASDIHIEPFDKFVKIRNRVDGVLIEVLRVDKKTLGALTTRIKILANMNIAEKRIPQDGRIITNVDGNQYDLRVSSLPTVYGEKVVIRILSKQGFLIGMDKLGFFKDDMEKINRILSVPYGIVLVTGPTGSGKSTTLYTMLTSLNKSDVNIITVEDPVEYTMEGINQVNVNNKAGLTFASGLRSILRQDPDIVMIGEMRDNETAEIAVRAAITGHKVLSTVHTNDAPSTIVRLIDMGLEPYLVSTSVSGVVAQRLVRRICPYCKEEYKASIHEKKILGVREDENLTLYRGTGCSYCGNTGYSGRLGVYEIMEITREIREFIAEGKNTDEVRDLCIKSGMKDLRIYCTKHVLMGNTTVEELIKITFIKD